MLTLMLEALLGKQRILEIYLNNVEWGEGVFGAQAAARHYFRVDAARLGPAQAARLAVMLPAPKRFEKRPGSAYVAAARPRSWRAWGRWSCHDGRALLSLIPERCRRIAAAPPGWWSKRAWNTPRPSARPAAT